MDILFINAGIGGFSPVAVTDEKLFDNVLNVNFNGAFFTLSKFVPLLNDGASSKQGWDEATIETMTESMIASIPLAKIGAAEEVAKMVAYLSGEDASFITGSEFIIDGGRKL